MYHKDYILQQSRQRLCTYQAASVALESQGWSSPSWQWTSLKEPCMQAPSQMSTELFCRGLRDRSMSISVACLPHSVSVPSLSFGLYKLRSFSAYAPVLWDLINKYKEICQGNPADLVANVPNEGGQRPMISGMPCFNDNLSLLLKSQK